MLKIHRLIVNMSTRSSSDMALFRRHLESAKAIVILTGAGVSAESGIPTFRGAGGLWRKYEATRLATPEAFTRSSAMVEYTGAGVSAESGIPTFRGAGGLWRKYEATRLATPQAFTRSPALVWEFYHYRRELCRQCLPNTGHMAIAECQKRMNSQGKRLTVITQNVDDLHQRAGTLNVIPLHGSLYRIRCTRCDNKWEDNNSPICSALKDKGAPHPEAIDADIPIEALPHCPSCGHLDIVWFGESLNGDVMEKAENEMDKCDLCLIVGTSSVVYPAAMFAPQIAARGVPVAEFNLEQTGPFGFYFSGPAGETLPIALAPFE